MFDEVYVGIISNEENSILPYSEMNCTHLQHTCAQQLLFPIKFLSSAK